MRHRCALVAAVSPLASCRSSDVGGPGGVGATRWRAALLEPAGSSWLGTPALDDARLFVQDGNLLRALDRQTGAALWDRPVRVAPAPPPTTLLAQGGRVYVSETDSVLAVDAASGRTLWNFHPDSQAVVVPALDATTLYTGQRGTPVVYALSLVDGHPRWRVNLGVAYAFGAAVQGIAVRGDTVYATVWRDLTRNGGASSGVLVALDARSGRELWRYETPGDHHNFYFAPVLAGNVALLDDEIGGRLLAIDLTTHAEAWHVTDGDGLPSVGGTTVYAAGRATTALAIDLATGAVRWQVKNGSSAFSSAVCGGRFVVNDDMLRFRDLATGALVGQVDRPYNEPLSSGLATDGEAVYVTGAGGIYGVTCR